MRRVFRRLGAAGGFLYYYQSWRRRFLPQRGLFTVRSSRSMYPLACRAGTSDWDVFRQVFVQGQYRNIDLGPTPDWIIDCGANVGFATAWLLSAFPTCRVLAVEPDPANFERLLETCRPYGGRVRAVHGAVWSHDTTLRMASTPFRDNREWTRQVHPEGTGTPVPAYSLRTLVAKTGVSRVSLLKMDIEGAETVVFREPPETWLGLVDTLVVELHADSPFGSPVELLKTALEQAGFSWRKQGELTVCYRSRP